MQSEMVLVNSWATLYRSRIGIPVRRWEGIGRLHHCSLAMSQMRRAFAQEARGNLSLDPGQGTANLIARNKLISSLWVMGLIVLTFFKVAVSPSVEETDNLQSQYSFLFPCKGFAVPEERLVEHDKIISTIDTTRWVMGDDHDMTQEATVTYLVNLLSVPGPLPAGRYHQALERMYREQADYRDAKGTVAPL
jgi:hypothetical protein